MTLKLRRKHFSKNIFKIKRSNVNGSNLYHVMWLLIHTFKYNILNKVLYLNETFFEFKIVSSSICSFCNSANETPIHLFYSCNQTKFLWSKFPELLNSEIFLPQNTPQRTFFSFPENKENLEIINHLFLIFKRYLFKSQKTRKISPEGLKKNIIEIHNTEKQICFNDSKKS